MSSDMSRRTQVLFFVFVALATLFTTFALRARSLQHMIEDRLAKGWILPPLELYSQGTPLSPGRRLDVSALAAELKRRDLQPERDYVLGDAGQCQAASGGLLPSAPRCLWLREPSVMVSWGDDLRIRELWTGEPLAPATHFALFPRLITQLYEGQPILQENTPISETPLYCLQAVTAIEDRDFLEHRGVSATGILRAIVRNVRKGRWAEGGSTITQQLVKNFFLTPKKTIRRKLEEQLLAILLESQLTKDQIFEMYMNVIYMGQSGPYQVRGLGSASQYYFDKPIAQLSLPECALIAAMINSPGRYSPTEHPEPARTRRELVLKKMREAEMISEADMNEAARAPLPRAPKNGRGAHAPYFVASSLREFQNWDIDTETGARVYTTLDPEVQAMMVDTAQRLLPVVEKRVKKPSKQPLQVAMMTVDLVSNQVLALIGGRDFKTSPYNRATDSRRQIGSTIKPFVYLPAMGASTPLSEVVDEPFEWKVGKQVWKPRNFEKTFEGPVPMFYALAESLNVAAAKVGQQVGLEKIAGVVRAAGIRAEVPRLPSLTLGAFELSLEDVAQGYSTLARLGHGNFIHTVTRVDDLNGELLFARTPAKDLELDPRATSIVVGMLQQSLETGTARAARGWGLQGTYAGKTGTTSDTKDAWFAGFNGRLLTVVWVGYDDNTVLGLTGAGAALPLWVDFTKRVEALYQPEDFKWPSGVEPRTFKREELLQKFPSLKNLPEEIQLILPQDLS